MTLMRFFIMLFFVSCTSVLPLRYKYHSSSRYLAGNFNEDRVVAKIEGELRDSVIFASGVDSTFLNVRLYDEKNKLIDDIDPNDLTISTSEDVEAKPFVLKQGIYKSEIRPRVKGRDIRLRVDWQEKILSQEILLRTTLVPVKNELIPLHHEFVHSMNIGEVAFTRGSSSPEGVTEGFSLENIGDNRIVKDSKYQHSQRSFNFDYLEQARQNLLLEVEDQIEEDESQTMRSVFMFFPRKNLPLVEQLTGTIDVTLPNGEKIIFRKDTKEIVQGVFLEGPVDIQREVAKRQFAHLRYVGKAVVLRVNSRGQLPQLAQFDPTKIDLDYGIHGAFDVLIMNGATGQRCRRPRIDFWEAPEVGGSEFKFATDKEFDQYLKRSCGFGLPKF
jgi:hypothetical protein